MSRSGFKKIDVHITHHSHHPGRPGGFENTHHPHHPGRPGGYEKFDIHTSTSSIIIINLFLLPVGRRAALHQIIGPKTFFLGEISKIVFPGVADFPTFPGSRTKGWAPYASRSRTMGATWLCSDPHPDLQPELGSRRRIQKIDESAETFNEFHDSEMQNR